MNRFILLLWAFTMLFPPANSRATSPSLTESGQFKGLRSLHARQSQTAASARLRSDYYERRAYPGAPPVIPHPAWDFRSENSQNCLACHQHGDYTPVYKTYAPVTPHPEFISCRQCHVPRETGSFFRPTEWKRLPPPKTGRPMIAGGPPPVPHTLQLRENCLACHGGPATPAGLRTSHPERVHCQQCHVSRKTQQTFTR